MIIPFQSILLVTTIRLRSSILALLHLSLAFSDILLSIQVTIITILMKYNFYFQKLCNYFQTTASLLFPSSPVLLPLLTSATLSSLLATTLIALDKMVMSA